MQLPLFLLAILATAACALDEGSPWDTSTICDDNYNAYCLVACKKGGYSGGTCDSVHIISYDIPFVSGVPDKYIIAVAELNCVDQSMLLSTQ